MADRAKDTIIVGDFDVYAAAVAAVLRGRPAAADAAVIGLLDCEWGERVHAVSVAASPADGDVLRAFGRSVRPVYKAPKAVTLVGSLPLAKFGKVDKNTPSNDARANRTLGRTAIGCDRWHRLSPASSFV